MSLVLVFPLGALILIIGIISFFIRRSFIINSKVTTGVVKDIVEGYVDHMKTYFPVVEYNSENESEKQRFKSDAGFSRRKYKKGDIVEVRYYHNGKKEKACLNTFFAVWGFSLIFTSIGLLFSVIGLLIILNI